MIKTKNLVTASFIFISILIYVTFLILDFGYKNTAMISQNLKFISILLCFITSLSIDYEGVNFRDTRLLQLGLFFTILSDLCLLLLDYFTLGVFLFCIVQSIYIVRCTPDTSFVIMKKILQLALLLIVLTLIFRLFNSEFQLLYSIALIYGILLITSTYAALRSFEKSVLPKTNYIMVSIGMCFFVLCDVNVGLYNISQNIGFGISNPATNVTIYLIWLFYLPAQVLLTLSGFTWK